MGAPRITRTLLVAKPGLMRNALTAYLRAMPGVTVDTVGELSDTVLPVVLQRHPNAVILDADVTDDLLTLLGQLHAQQPNLNYIVLADSVAQQEAALAAGADYALLKGFLDERLGQAVLSSEANAQKSE
jgi:DNA-binding NarL/FixJ family response regulator